MDAAKVEEIMAKVPRDRLSRAVGRGMAGVYVFRGESLDPINLTDTLYHCSIPGCDWLVHFKAERMDPLTPAEADEFLARMRSALEAN